MSSLGWSRLKWTNRDNAAMRDGHLFGIIEIFLEVPLQICESDSI